MEHIFSLEDKVKELDGAELLTINDVETISDIIYKKVKEMGNI